MKKMIVANWKLNPKTLSAAGKLLKAVAPAVRQSASDAVFCVPAPYLAPLSITFPKFTFGAQDASYIDEGPLTGAIGPSALKSVGARYVILGHSERRAAFGETDEEVAKKVAAAITGGLIPIVCIGEPLAVRRKGMSAPEQFVARQLKAILKNVSRTAKIVIAYEPVWAISTSGSGKSETPKDAAAMIRFIKKIRPGRVIYGGSANGKNSAELLSYREIDGLLVGGASLRPEEFSAILKYA